MERRGEFDRGLRRRVPVLSEEGWRMLVAIEIAGGRALSEVHFSKGGVEWSLDWGKGHGRR